MSLHRYKKGVLNTIENSFTKVIRQLGAYFLKTLGALKKSLYDVEVNIDVLKNGPEDLDYLEELQRNFTARVEETEKEVRAFLADESSGTTTIGGQPETKFPYTGPQYKQRELLYTTTTWGGRYRGYIRGWCERAQELVQQDQDFSLFLVFTHDEK